MKKLILTLLFCLFSLSSFAKEGIFSINNIKMDITEENSVKAKKTAVMESQKQAFKTLIKRLSILNDDEILALNIQDKDIKSTIIDFNISEEKTSDVRYTGTFNFNFDPRKTSKLLKDKKVSFTTLRSGDVLIIPLWIHDNKTTLWESNNIWKQAWESFPNDSFLVPTKLPLGDLMDLSQISAEDTLSGEIKDLKEILKRYEVKDAVVTIAKKEKTGLMIYINRYGLDGVSSKSSVFIDGINKTYGAVLSESVTQVNEELSNLWKEKTLTKPDEVSYIESFLKISSIEDLNKIKSILDNITMITSYKESLLTTEEVNIDIYYQGSFFDLKLALSQFELIAEKTNIYSCNLIWE